MADRIKGITVEIGGDTTKLSDALKKVNKSIKETQNQLKDVNKLLKLDPGNTDLLRQKQKYLSDAIKDTKEKLEQEQAALKQLKDVPQTEETIKQQEALTREIEDTKQALKGLEDQYKSVGSVAGVQLQVAGQKMKDVGDKITGVGEGLSTHVTAPIAAVGAASLAAFNEVDAGADIVKTKTGAVGQALKDMQNQANEIASAAKRVEFQRMMEDCREGKIDRILTKSISRFARNTLDCIEYVRELKQLNVTILFEKEHIDTAGAYSEMILTVLAAFAQEESRSLSENIKWGVRKRFQDGTDRWVSIYGYTKEGDETYVIVDDEAAVIREIFNEYEHGLSTAKIGEELDKAKVPTPLGKAHWDAALVHSILENVKYCGDIILQKFYTADHLSHECVKNDGSEVPQYYIKDHHPAIVTREQYRRVEKIRHMNNKKNLELGGNYPYGNLLRCPFCGRKLHQSKLGIYGNQRGWTCESEDFLLRSDLLDPAVLECYEKLPVENLTDTENPDVQKVLYYKKKHPEFSQVDFYWVDDLIESIELGTHSGTDDHTVTVHWKCGLVTTAETDPTKMTESPQVLCRQSVEKRKELRERKLELRREKLRKKDATDQVQEENTDLKAQLAELMKRQQEQDELIKKLLEKAGT